MRWSLIKYNHYLFPHVISYRLYRPCIIPVASDRRLRGPQEEVVQALLRPERLRRGTDHHDPVSLPQNQFDVCARQQYYLFRTTAQEPPPNPRSCDNCTRTLPLRVRATLGDVLTLAQNSCTGFTQSINDCSAAHVHICFCFK